MPFRHNGRDALHHTLLFGLVSVHQLAVLALPGQPVALCT